ncbi:MAG: DNA polymerase I [Candidatus Omnitrophica bacterium]|nr:DNA polymerase I [Candidatus Omnitrophota bacterium]
MTAKLCLIDANSLFYRAFYAIKAQLVTSRGEPTNAVFGFVRMVKKILDDIQPQFVAVCFDVGKVTHRTKKFSAYKIHRPPMPEALLSQVPYIKDVVRAYRFALCECEGFEADDVIATLTGKLSGKVDKIVIVSSDKDILQLVSEDVEVYNPYKDDGIIFTPKVVEERMGVSPGRIADLIALAGDASDNIPGAKGIGEKTALELLKTFKDIDDLIRHKEKVVRGPVRKIIGEREEDIRLSKELALLRFDAPVEADLEDLKLKGPDIEKLWEIYSRLEFRGMLKELSQERFSGAKQLAIPKRDDMGPEEIAGRIAKTGLLAFAVNEADPKNDVLNVNVACDEKTVYGVNGPQAVGALLRRDGCVMISHDVKSGRHLLRDFGIEIKGTFFDTMIAAYLLDSSRRAGELDNLIWDHLQEKTMSRQDYLGRESHFLVRLKNVLSAALKEKKLDALFCDVEMPLVDVLFEMESAGIQVDTAFLADLSAQLEKKLARIVKRIFELAGCDFNINSPKQLSEVLFHKLKLPVVKKTKTGLSTDEEVLHKLSTDFELPRLLLEYRQMAKLKTTYIDALPGLIDERTGKIHSSFNQTGTETGRLSSSDPNLQNIPIKTEMGRRVRQAFVPSKGFDVLLSADYSQVELRILAHLSEDPVLMEAFREERDIHRYTASLIFGVKEEDVTPEMRENAKRVNFGIVYGMSSYGLSKDLGIDGHTAEAFISEYFLRYPRVKAYLDGQIDFVRKNGYVMTLLGRRRYIPEIHNPNAALRQFAERQAVNAPIQGSAADLIKLAMVDLHKRLREGRFQSRLVLQVHDELVLEVVRAELKEAAGQVRRSMENILALKVPLKVSMKTGKNWLEMEEQTAA